MTWRGIEKGSSLREVQVIEGSSYRDSTVVSNFSHAALTIALLLGLFFFFFHSRTDK